MHKINLMMATGCAAALLGGCADPAHSSNENDKRCNASALTSTSQAPTSRQGDFSREILLHLDAQLMVQQQILSQQYQILKRLSGAK